MMAPVRIGFNASATAPDIYSPRRRPRRLLQAIVLVAAAITASQGVTTAAAVNPYQQDVPLAEHWSGGQWAAVPTPFFGTSSVSGFYGVSGVPGDVWAVGYAYGCRPNCADSNALSEHWDGQSWSVVPQPPGTDNQLGSVTGSGNDVYAAGTTSPYSGGYSLVEHWDGKRWTIAPGASVPSGTLTGITMLDSDDVWAVGYDQSGPLLEHYDGSAWTSKTLSGNNNFFQAVSGSAPNDVWAVGCCGANSSALAEHFNGSTWQNVPTPAIHNQYFSATAYAVTTISADDAWLVGEYSAGNGQRTLTEHWNGTAWSIVTAPSPQAQGLGTVLYGVAYVSPHDVWAVGTYGKNSAVSRTLVERWNGNVWQVVASPSPAGATNYNFLSAVTASRGAVWAVGEVSQGD